jgi:hypothetical protein
MDNVMHFESEFESEIERIVGLEKQIKTLKAEITRGHAVIKKRNATIKALRDGLAQLSTLPT